MKYLIYKTTTSMEDRPVWVLATPRGEWLTFSTFAGAVRHLHARLAADEARWWADLLDATKAHLPW